MSRFPSPHINHLRTLVTPDRVTTAESELVLHSRDESHHEPALPGVVIYPLSAQEIASVLRWANEQRVPVTPWGAATSLEGNPIPTHGGIVLDFTRMNHIKAIRPEDLQAVVEPGVTHTQLNEQLGRHGLFFPPDPGAPATIGGMVANNAAGIQAVKYGATKYYVLKLEIVLATGEIMTVGTNALRSSSGYDLVRLLVGSEGTLAIFSEITLRLTGIPKEASAATAAFRELAPATRACVQLVQAGLEPAALELLDHDCMRGINLFKGLALPELPTLFLEFRGQRAEVQEDLSLAEEICKDCGCASFSGAIGRAARDRLWEARHHLFYAAAAVNPGRRAVVVDVAVPISRFPDMVEFARKTLQEQQMSGPILGHAGDGNFHVGIFYKPDEGIERAKALAVSDGIVLRALEWGGTASGEHGIGIGKRKFMRAEHGPSYEVMKQIKRAFDPQGILNPGKIFD